MFSGYSSSEFGSNKTFSCASPKFSHGESYSVEVSGKDRNTKQFAGIVATTCAAALFSHWTISTILSAPTNPNADINSEISKLQAKESKNIEAAIAKLITFYSYEQNWDGYSGVIPSGKAVDDAITFLRKLPNHSFIPRPGISGDGEIGLFWETKNLFVDIGFIGDGKYSYYAKDRDDKEIFGDDIKITESISDELKNVFPIV